MNYEMVNEELQIASVRLADLTMKQVESFLKNWEPGASIGELAFSLRIQDS